MTQRPVPFGTVRPDYAGGHGAEKCVKCWWPKHEGPCKPEGEESSK